MVIDPVPLSRIQFGLAISFHIIFPAFATLAVLSWPCMIPMWSPLPMRGAGNVVFLSVPAHRIVRAAGDLDLHRRSVRDLPWQAA
jgi:hypothetical protein